MTQQITHAVQHAAPTSPPMAQSFSDMIRSRHSVREFLSDPVPPEVIRGVLEDAQSAPSHSNTQPWLVHIASGATRDELSAEMVAAYDEQRFSRDFTDTYGDGLYQERSRVLGAKMYDRRGIARDDREGRNEVVRDNLRFYGAPHVAMLFLPQLGDAVRAASDVGMYGQNFLLSLHARGYHGIPQAVHGMFADTVRKKLGVSDEFKLIFGIAFGTAKPGSRLFDLAVGRVPLSESVVLHDTTLD
ncbi:nitroreductase [Streptomyces sp. NPDC006552]|uniref:nitroreductase n=1 Tax=Streptomyces sp. NPDC006552 TaxID=3157179 RepID=UPI0033B13186